MWLLVSEWVKGCKIDKQAIVHFFCLFLTNDNKHVKSIKMKTGKFSNLCNLSGAPLCEAKRPKLF